MALKNKLFIGSVTWGQGSSGERLTFLVGSLVSYVAPCISASAKLALRYEIFSVCGGFVEYALQFLELSSSEIFICKL